MGHEARLRQERIAAAEGSAPVWEPASQAPANGGPFAVACTITCNCGKGGRVVVTGDRHKGEWVMTIEHQVDITHFMRLPLPPGMSGRRREMS